MYAKKLKNLVQEKINKSAESRNILNDDSTIELSKDERFGDLTTNCAMIWSKRLKRNPNQIAQELLDEWELPKECFHTVSIAGAGFINLTLNDVQWSTLISSILDDQETNHNQETDHLPSYHIEFVSANPTGPLNIVSARAATIGDVLANILRFLGYKVHTEFYVNNAGKQVQLLGESVYERWKEIQGISFSIPEDGYHGDYVKEIAKLLQDKMNQSTPISTVSNWAVEIILQSQKEIIKKFRTHFDEWFLESQMRENDEEWKMLEKLKSSEYIYEKDGAVYLKTSSTGYDDKDRVVVTSQGAPTYFLPDIAYHWNKYSRGFSYAVNFLGPDHHGVIGRMAAAMKMLNIHDNFLQIRLIQQVSLLRDGQVVKMSKRAGEIVTLEDLLEELGDKETAIDVTRFFFLQRKVSTPLDFDLTLAKKQNEENPAFYVQYAHARICSILRQEELLPFIEKKWDASAISNLKEVESIRILRKLLEFPFVLERCAQSLDPNGLSTYLTELAASFHKFYHNHRVIGQPENITFARVKLLQAIKKILSVGLSLCKVTAPERM